MTSTTDNDRYIGRERDLEQLTSAVDHVVDGHGGVVIVGGEPGIGKSRILEEIESYAADSGALVIHGTCYEGDSTSPSNSLPRKEGEQI